MSDSEGLLQWLRRLIGGSEAERPSSRRRLGRSRPRAVSGTIDERAAGLESAPTTPVRLTGATTWAYKLQHNTVDLVAGCNADVFVMDPHSDGMRTVFSATDVERMKGRPGGGRKVLLAYMSIGEAEENRFYWNPGWAKRSGGSARLSRSAPKWLAAQNGEGWVDNYKVRYWDPDWQQIIIGPGNFLDRIVTAGFDGVYLDIIDGFEFFEDQRKTARAEMIAFVARIAETARQKSPGFLIVPQNGEQLFASKSYRDVVSAIGKEDILFNQKAGVDINSRCVVARQSADQIKGTIDNLALGLADGIPVLSIEYLYDEGGNEKRIPEVAAELRKLGYIPYFGDRHLERLHPILPPPSGTAGV